MTLPEGWDTYPCNSTDTATGEPCQRQVKAPNEEAAVCWEHETEDNPKPKRSPGAPIGNDNGDGAPPEGNFNAAKHGKNMSLERRKEFFEAKGYGDIYRSIEAEILQKAENETFAGMLASYVVIQFVIQDELLDDGFFETIPEVNEEGEPIPDPETGEPIETKRIQRYLDAFFKAGKEARLLGKYEGYTGNKEGDGGDYDNKSQIWNDNGDDDVKEATIVANDAEDGNAD